MRVWLVRLRTALAVVAALFLIWEVPVVYRMISQPLGEPDTQPTPLILRVWIHDDFTGTATQWLTKQAASFEKANRGTRVVVRKAQRGDWALEGTVVPDVLLFARGSMDLPMQSMKTLTQHYGIRPLLSDTGKWNGEMRAVPVAYSGLVMLTNETKPEGADLVMGSEREYMDFSSQHARTLVASPREARRLTALLDAGKGFPFLAEPHGTHTDKLLMASLFEGKGDRADAAETFLAFLLSDIAQNALPASGLLPTTNTAQAPDAEKQPLLHALYEAITSASAAFGTNP